MHTPVIYTASPCHVKKELRQNRQRGTGIIRKGKQRERISGGFFEVLDYVVAHLNRRRRGTC